MLDHLGFGTTVDEEERLVKVYGRQLVVILALILAICVSLDVGLAILIYWTLDGNIRVGQLVAAMAFSTAAASATLHIRRYRKNRRRPHQNGE